MMVCPEGNLLSSHVNVFRWSIPRPPFPVGIETNLIPKAAGERKPGGGESNYVGPPAPPCMYGLFAERHTNDFRLPMSDSWSSPPSVVVIHPEFTEDTIESLANCASTRHGSSS